MSRRRGDTAHRDGVRAVGWSLEGEDAPAGILVDAHDDARLERDVRPVRIACVREGIRGIAAGAGDDGGAGLLEAGRAPVTGGVRPHALVLTSPDALHGVPEAPPPVLDGVGPVSTATARQICCDAEATDVVVRNGEVLDVGRRRRLFTEAQRAALIAQYGACVGCGAPAWPHRSTRRSGAGTEGRTG